MLSNFGENSEKKTNGHHYGEPAEDEEDGVEYDDDEEEAGLTDELDHRILMHRDAHFAGEFEVMLRYYNNEDNVGIDPDFDPDRIAYLANLEKEMGQNLASLLLGAAEAEAVGRARKAYGQFKELYELEEKSPIPRLIADLILSEKEEPVEEIEAVVAQGPAIVPELLALLNSDDFYDPLFPGYGYAPFLAIICLGKIGDTRAIIPLFETFSKHFIFDEMAIVEAFAEIGQPAKEFLLKILKSRPLTQDNPNAAFALSAFAEDSDVTEVCFEQLEDPQVLETPLLRAYLQALCESVE